MTTIERYIAKNQLDGKKIADVLRDYDLGHCTLGDICYFYGYSLDRAVWHLDQCGHGHPL